MSSRIFSDVPVTILFILFVNHL